MAQDYDAPRKGHGDVKDAGVEAVKASSSGLGSPTVDVDETEVAEALVLPGSDLSDTKLEVTVTPTQDDEFTCIECFLVHHTSQRTDPTSQVCTDCLN
jgi:hypothetical protein